MRIYLPTGQEIEGEKPGRRIYPKGFHLVPDELGQKWVDEGLAMRATDANEVFEPEPEPEPEDEAEASGAAEHATAAVGMLSSALADVEVATVDPDSDTEEEEG